MKKLGIETADLDLQNPLDSAVADSVDCLELAIARLRNDCERLARSLDSTIKECERWLTGDAGHINPCGVVQGLGADIDQKCGQIDTMRDSLRRLLIVKRQIAEKAAAK